MITTLSYQREGRIYNCKLLQYLRGIHFIHTWEWQVRMTEDGSSRDSFQFWGIAFLQVYSPRYLRKETFSVFTYSLCLSISLKLSQCNLYSPLMLLQARRFILFLIFLTFCSYCLFYLFVFWSLCALYRKNNIVTPQVFNEMVWSAGGTQSLDLLHLLWPVYLCSFHLQ